MDWQVAPYTLPLFGAAAVSAALAVYAWRRRLAPGVAPSIALMLAVTVWSAGSGLELSSATLAAKLLWARVSYLGIVAIPVAWLVFVFEYTNRTRWLTRRNLFLLRLPSAAALLLVWTNDLHHLFWAGVRLDAGDLFSTLVLTHGPAFWAMIAYNYSALLLGSALLFQGLSRRAALYRGQAAVVLAGLLAPWAANILYITGNSPLPSVDPTPLALTFTCLAVVWGLFRFRLLDVVPVAYGALLDSMDDAVIVLDRRGRIVDANPAAERLTGCRAAEEIGRPAAAALAAMPALARWLDGPAEARDEIALGQGQELRICDAGSSLLRGRRGRAIGRLVVLRDITARKLAEQEIRDSEQKYRTLFETSTDAIFVETLEGRVLDCNAAACDMLGYSKEELVGMAVADLMPEEVARTLPAFITEEVTTGGAFVEAANRRKDGQVFPVEVSSRLVTVGEDLMAIVYVRDITERKRIEQQSDERRRYLESVLACAPSAIVTLDAQQLVLDWNRGAEELFGYRREEAIGRDLDELVAGADAMARQEAARLSQQVLAGMAVPPIETVRYRKDGAPVEVIVAGAPIVVQGELAGVVATYRDVTRRKRAERELIESEQKYRTLVEQSLQGIIIAQGRSPRVVFANQAIGEIIGYSVEEIKSFSPEKLWAGVYTEDKGEFSQRYQARLDGNREPHRYEIRLLRRDGTPRWAEIFTSRIDLGGEPAVQAAFVDITERKRAEEALRRRTRELALLNRVIAASAAGQGIVPILETACRELAAAFGAMHAAAALLDAGRTGATVVAEHREGGPLALGQTFAVAGVPLAGSLAQHRAPLLVDDARSDPRLGPIGSLIPPGEPLALLLLPILIEGELAGALELAAAGPGPFSPEEVALAGRVADEVSGALDRARLAEAGRRLSAAVEQAAEAIAITAPDATILYVNPAFEQITGFARAEVVGRPAGVLGSSRLALLFQGWPCPGGQAGTGQTVTAGQPWREKLEYARRDGRACHLDITIAPVRDAGGEVVSYVTTMRDVTRETQLEAQFQQAQRMEALGRLAGGIAHDFNNLLAVIQISAQLLERKLPPGDPLLDDVAPISDTVRRAAGLTRQLVSFSRGEVVKPQVLSLNQVVGDLAPMLQVIAGAGIRLVTALTGDLWPVRAGPAQIEQVIANLAVNARDAMPGGGTLTIETANAVLDEAYAALHVEAQPGEYVRLAVTDTGVGMDEAVKERIFEPFFTTKEPGHGTGLGLSTVFGIVKQSEGQIEVSSRVGQGTTFTIYLPRAQEELPAPGAPARDLPAVPGRVLLGTETVLLVEDDAPVRELAARVLASCGYRVLAAADAMEALQIGERHDGPIHLLLSDVILPHMSGDELAGRLVERRPGTRVVFMSGYADGAIGQQGAAFLSKPFTIDDLTRVVRETLDGGVGVLAIKT